MTVLGLYYKWQAFFFIPLGAMQTCIVPVVSYNYAEGKYERCKKTLKVAIAFGIALMMIGVILFETIPGSMLHVFSHDSKVISIGRSAIPLYWNQFYSTGKFSDVPGIFSGVGICGKKFDFDDYSNGVFIYSVGVLIFQIWIELFLADISGDGLYHNAGRISDSYRQFVKKTMSKR